MWITVISLEFLSLLPCVGVLVLVPLLVYWIAGGIRIYGFCLTSDRLLLLPARSMFELAVYSDLEVSTPDRVVCTYFRENALHTYLDLVIDGRPTKWAVSRTYRQDARALGWLPRGAPAVGVSS